MEVVRIGIEAQRLYHGWTVEEAAQHIGITPSAYNSYVSGAKMPVAVFEKMFQAFGCAPGFIYLKYPEPLSKEWRSMRG